VTILRNDQKSDYCGPSCSKKAARRRAAGLAEDAFPDERGKRGRVALGAPTSAEVRRLLLPVR